MTHNLICVLFEDFVAVLSWQGWQCEHRSVTDWPGMIEWRELRGAAFISVVEATEMGNGHDVAVGRRRDLTRHRRIFL